MEIVEAGNLITSPSIRERGRSLRHTRPLAGRSELFCYAGFQMFSMLNYMYIYDPPGTAAITQI